MTNTRILPPWIHTAFLLIKLAYGKQYRALVGCTRSVLSPAAGSPSVQAGDNRLDSIYRKTYSINEPLFCEK